MIRETIALPRDSGCECTNQWAHACRMRTGLLGRHSPMKITLPSSRHGFHLIGFPARVENVFQLGDGFKIFGPTSRALHFNQTLKCEAMTFYPCDFDLDRISS